MASQQEFRKVNEIINTVKRADGQNANIFDVLDVCKVSLDWWRRHKKWIFYRYPYLTQQKIDGDNFLVYTKPEEL